jgi:hypothetical protein
MVTASLRDEVEYIALSSLYGDPKAVENILVDGQRVGVPANVAAGIRHVRAVFLPALIYSKAEANGKPVQLERKGGPPRWLVHALRHVRSIFPSDDSPQEKPLRLWLDALCINHGDARETKEQLVHMGQVYRQAKVVVGWLGPADENSEMGIDTIKFVNDVMPPNWGDDEDKLQHPENYSPQHEWFKHIAHFWAEPDGDSATDVDESLPDNQNWLAVAHFLNRDYFNRSWILGEMGMARYPTFLAGTKILSWKHILRLTRLIEEMRDTESDIFPAKLRPMVHQFPLAIVYDFLADFEKRRKEDRQGQLDSSRQSDITQGTGSTNTYL